MILAYAGTAALVDGITGHLPHRSSLAPITFKETSTLTRTSTTLNATPSTAGDQDRLVGTCFLEIKAGSSVGRGTNSGVEMPLCNLIRGRILKILC